MWGNKLYIPEDKGKYMFELHRLPTFKIKVKITIVSWRKYNKDEIINLDTDCKDNPSEMWAKIKRLSDPPSFKASLEIVNNDGTISRDIKEILDRWHTDISKLYSGLRENPDLVYNNLFYEEMLNKKSEFENLSENYQN